MWVDQVDLDDFYLDDEAWTMQEIRRDRERKGRISMKSKWQEFGVWEWVERPLIKKQR